MSSFSKGDPELVGRESGSYRKSEEEDHVCIPGKLAKFKNSIHRSPLTVMQIEGPTQAWSSSGLGQTSRKKTKASAREQQSMSVFSLEVFGMQVSTVYPGYPD